jgi:hypothetical protein
MDEQLLITSDDERTEEADTSEPWWKRCLQGIVGFLISPWPFGSIEQKPGPIWPAPKSTLEEAAHIDHD